MTLLLDVNIPEEANNNQRNKNETKQTNHTIENYIFIICMYLTKELGNNEAKTDGTKKRKR